jgi:ribosome biogenesis GTPase A
MSKTDNINGYEGKKTINWYPGHMAKTKREIAEKLNLIDVVYEVIDSRMPYSSKIVDIEDLIKDKPRILVMTKYDLCDEEETNKFVKYYEEQGYKVVTVDLMSNNNNGVKSIETIHLRHLISTTGISNNTTAKYTIMIESMIEVSFNNHPK